MYLLAIYQKTAGQSRYPVTIKTVCRHKTTDYTDLWPLLYQKFAKSLPNFSTDDLITGSYALLVHPSMPLNTVTGLCAELEWRLASKKDFDNLTRYQSAWLAQILAMSEETRHRLWFMTENRILSD